MEEQQAVNTILELVAYLLTASGGAAWLSTFLSDGRSGTVWRVIMSVVNIVGGNVGKAKNDAMSQ